MALCSASCEVFSIAYLAHRIKAFLHCRVRICLILGTSVAYRMLLSPCGPASI